VPVPSQPVSPQSQAPDRESEHLELGSLELASHPGISEMGLTEVNLTDAAITPDIAPVFALKQLVARLQREQSQTQELLASLSFALRSFNNLNQFLQLIPLVVGRVTDADAAALVLFKPNGQAKLEQMHCHETHQCPNIRSALERATLNLSTVPLSEGKRISRSEILDQQLREHLPPGLRWFATSILVKNKNSEQTERGRLYLFSQRPEYEWGDTRQQLMQLVADQTAVAIENDELSVELRKKERLDRELEIGAEIQERLLPSKCPEILGAELAASCKTANRVGGDYYDFIPIAYGQPQTRKPESQASARWGLVIGDVMGKGVPAGLIMTMTRGMLRAEVMNGHRPARILQHLNRVMFPDLEMSNRFVTLFYAEYNPLTQLLAYSNAAHHPPLLWQASTKAVRRLDTNGMLIGLAPQNQYQEAEVRLMPGDTIIFYTDGFTDAANPNGERFEEKNLSQAFLTACQTYATPKQILDYLFEQVQQFTGPQTPINDDMTLIVFKLKPKPAVAG
jgi:phosphoserine phosphatase RsbU/P